MGKESFDINKNTKVTTTELASVLGITARRILQLVQDGVLVRDESSNKLFTLSEAVQDYIKYLTKDQIDADEAKAEKSKKTAEAAIKVAKAKVAQIEAKEAEGKVHRSEDVEALTLDTLYTIRSALYAMPGRVALDVSEAESPAEAAAIIRRELVAIMTELSEYEYDPEKYAERVRDRKSWEGVEDDE